MKKLASTLLTAGLCLGSATALPASAASFDLAAALAAAPTNAVIPVPAGIYQAPIIIIKPVTLIAETGAVIQGSGQGTIVRIDAPDTTLSGFIICNSGKHLSSEDSGILVKAPRARIENNHLDHVLFGIYLKESPDSLVIGNDIRGYDLPLPVRGDGIRLWYSHHCVIADNDVQTSRDNIIWFSKNDIIAQNHFTHDRYGLHLMYDDGLTITNNWLADNFVGAFLMYSWHVTFERNICLNNRGVSGYGLGLKNIDVLRAADNRILDNTVGIWMNSSPSALVTNIFRQNVVAYNSTGLMIDTSDKGNVFTENTFMNNSQQVMKDSDGTLEGNHFSLNNRGNYWSDYKGYPGSVPGIGAVPYHIQNLFDSLADQYPNLQLFRFSPAQEAVDLAAAAFPLIQPEVVLTDSHPLMAPPAIQAAPLSERKSNAMMALSLSLLACIGLVIGAAEAKDRRHSAPAQHASGISTPDEQALVSVTGLSKCFGLRQVLRELNFAVPRGRAVAFWGGNGAGKSTTIKCILGLLNFQGTIQVGGLEISRQGKQARRLLGYVPQELSFYPDWTVRRTMDFCARLKRVPCSDVDRLLAEVGLEEQAARKVSELSGGMKQRLGLAVALLGDPPVLLLDEFTSNLDAGSRDALIVLLARQRSKGLTILFATHRMDEVEALADEVLFMEQGKIVRSSTVAELRHAAASDRMLKVTLPAGELEKASALLGIAGHKCQRVGENLLVEVNSRGAVAPLELLWEREIQIRELDLIHRAESAGDKRLFSNS